MLHGGGVGGGRKGSVVQPGAPDLMVPDRLVDAGVFRYEDEPQMIIRVYENTYPPTRELTKIVVDAMGDLTGKRVVDAGCGTGVLSVAAALKGASRVLAVDSKGDCLSCARDNALANGVDNVVAPGLSDLFRQVGGKHNLFVFTPSPYPGYDKASKTPQYQPVETVRRFF
ncbi:Ribosomal protein L11 methyltransferase [uncultured archaeon]|nr:Ribosomal protein L11 methyltransferase [uncultured archaeon]